MANMDHCGQTKITLARAGLGRSQEIQREVSHKHSRKAKLLTVPLALDIEDLASLEVRDILSRSRWTSTKLFGKKKTSTND